MADVPSQAGQGGGANLSARRAAAPVSARAIARRALLDDLTRRPVADGDRLLRTKDVALLFQVSERAVADWATAGKIPSVRTPGGHRRYPSSQVMALLQGTGTASPGQGE